MNTTLPILFAQFSTMIVYACLARWYVAPWLRRQQLSQALTPLVAIHLLRGVALQLYAAQASGFAISDAVRDHNVVGDVAGVGLALLTLAGLRFRMRHAPALAWLLIVETVLDVASGVPGAIKDHAIGSATGVTWLVLVYYVPAIMLSLGLMGWQLVSRHDEWISGIRTVLSRRASYSS